MNPDMVGAQTGGDGFLEAETPIEWTSLSGRP
jgi:hypothetical protein